MPIFSWMRLKEELKIIFLVKFNFYWKDHLLDSCVEEHSLEIFVLETFIVFWNETTTSELILISIEWENSLVLLNEISLTFGNFHLKMRTSIWELILNRIEKRYSQIYKVALVFMTYIVDILSSSSTLLSSRFIFSLDQTFCSVQVPEIRTPHNTVWAEVRLFIIIFSGINCIWPAFWWDIILKQKMKMMLRMISSPLGTNRIGFDHLRYRCDKNRDRPF